MENINNRNTIRRIIINKPSVLVLKEKHGTLYFYVADDEALFQAALEVVRGRSQGKYPYYYEPEAPKNPSITKEEVDSLPDALKGEGIKLLNRHKAENKQYLSDKDDWDTLQKALKENDGKAAWEFLKARRDHEYEYVSIEQVLQKGDYCK